MDIDLTDVLKCYSCDNMDAYTRSVNVEGRVLWTMNYCNACWGQVDTINLHPALLNRHIENGRRENIIPTGSDKTYT